MYTWRVRMIRCVPSSPSPSSSLPLTSFDGARSNRQAVNYHDYFGPTALCGCILLGVVVNFALRIKQGL